MQSRRKLGGKYAGSQLHGEYSHWHYGLREKGEKYKSLCLTDIDRLWVEVDVKRGSIVGVVDIKKHEGKDEEPTISEKIIYNWFNDRLVRVYIVFIHKNFEKFTVRNFRTGEEETLTRREYADWLLYWRKRARTDLKHDQFMDEWFDRVDEDEDDEWGDFF